MTGTVKNDFALNSDLSFLRTINSIASTCRIEADEVPEHCVGFELARIWDFDPGMSAEQYDS